MKKTFFSFWVVLMVLLTGCSFLGESATTSPTKLQIKKCQNMMHLNSSDEIVPLGYMLSGFQGFYCLYKFKTGATELQDVFDKEFVDTSKFKSGFILHTELGGGIEWWNIKNKELFGGVISLNSPQQWPAMTVGAEKTDDGFIVYVFYDNMH